MMIFAVVMFIFSALTLGYCTWVVIESDRWGINEPIFIFAGAISAQVCIFSLAGIVMLALK